MDRHNPIIIRETMKKITYILILLIAAATATKAQQGFGTSTPAPSSVIDMTATHKGVLMPRVALTGLTDVTTIPSAANTLTVFNTATTTMGDGNDVTPGYYYWNNTDTKWVRLLTSIDAAVNIYNADGSLTDNRSVDMNGKYLRFINGDAYTDFADGARLYLNNNVAGGSASLGLRAGPTGGSLADFLIYDGVEVDLAAGSPAAPLPLYINTKGDAPIGFFTNNRLRGAFTSSGNFGIGIDLIDPSNALHVIPAAGADPVRFEGLKAGASTDNLVTVDATGILKTIPQTVVTTLYNGNGTINGNRTVTFGSGASLLFSSTGGKSIQLQAAQQVITNTAGRANIQLQAGVSPFNIFIDPGSTAQITSGAAAVGATPSVNTPMSIGTSGNASLKFFTNNTQRALITNDGNVIIGNGTPTSTLQVDGSVAAAIKVTSSSYTLTDKDHTLILSGVATAGSITVTFPKASTCPGRIYIVVNNTADAAGSTSISPQMFSSFNGTAAELKYASGDSPATATLLTGLTTAGSPINIPVTNQRTVWQSDGNNTWWLISL